MSSPDHPDLAGAAERLRSWLDDLALATAADRPGAPAGPEPDVDGLAAWHQSHAPHLIAAALALEALAAPAAAPTPRPDL